MKSLVRASLCAVLAVSAACVGAGSSSGVAAPRPGGRLHIEDRVVIPEMTAVLGIAASDRLVFIATRFALGMYDHRFQTWLPPVSIVDGWPGTDVNALVDDPGDPDAVWVVAGPAVYRIRAGDSFVMRALVGEPVAAALGVAADDPSGGLIVRTSSGQTLRVSQGGAVSPYRATGGVRGSVTLGQIYARFPAIRNFERTLTQDASLRAWPLRAAALIPNKSEVWYATIGGGAFKVDPLFVRSEQKPFGLLTAGAGAIAPAVTGVWIGGAGFGGPERGGLTFASQNLQQWVWADGGVGASFPPGARVNAISLWGSGVWAATDRGLIRLDTQTGALDRRWDNATGLAAANVLSVAATPDGAWVGTTTGLTFVRNAPTAAQRNADAPVLTGTAVRALLRRGDTLWIGSEIGALALVPDEPRPRPLRAAETDRRLAEPIVALASSDSIVALATLSGAVIRIDVRSGRALDAVSYVNSSRAGRINGLAMDARTLWVAGDQGVIVVDRASGAERFLSSARDIPGEAYGIALLRDYAWVAARGGAVRLRRTEAGLIW